jgi:transposase InsO family protein
VRNNLVNELRYFAITDREQVASRIVLKNCTDPILSPKVYDTFSDEQKLTIRNYYMQTALLANAYAAPSYELEVSVFDYIEGFYNRVQRHSSLGYLSPTDYEQATMEEVVVA